MACDQSTLNRPACAALYASPRKQLEAQVTLLCNALSQLGGEIDCGDWNAVLAEAQALGLTCRSPQQLRAKAAEIICAGLGVDCDALACLPVLPINTFLTCGLVDAFQPATYNCVDGDCVDPGDGSGAYMSLQACEEACEEPPAVSYNCVDGGCVDPGDGSGEFSTLEACEAACVEAPSNRVSFAFWLELLSQPSPAGADIISNYDFELWDDPSGTRQSRIRLSCAATGGGANTYTFTVAVSQGATSNTGSSSPIALPLRTWHHVAVVYDGDTGFASVYVDTVLVATSSGTPVTLTSQPYGYLNTTNAGHSVVDYLDSYVCLQDMTGVWVGHELTGSELTVLYNSGAGFNGPPWTGLTTPTAWWDFDDAGRVDATENFVDEIGALALDPSGSIVQLEGLLGFAVVKSGFARTLETEVVATFAYTA